MFLPAAVDQVIVARADGWNSSRATLRRFERHGEQWTAVGEPVRAWAGINGFAPALTRRQNSGQTPAGTFTLPGAFGAGPGSGIALPYRRITKRSYWPYDPRDPRTYNVFQTSRAKSARWRDDGQWSERLASYGRAYRYSVVIGYNLPGGLYRGSGEWRARQQAQTGKGGGIFLHVARGRPTAGCLSVPLSQARSIARWLDPSRDPRIVIGPKSLTHGWRTRMQ